MAGDTLLTEKEREMINLGTSLAAGCQPCMKYHLRKCREIGLCKKEIHEIINLTEYICTRAFRIMKVRGLTFFIARQNPETGVRVKCESRRDFLVGLAVSYALNNTDLTNRYLQHARQSGISDSAISRIVELSRFTCSKARAHVDILIEGRGVEVKAEELDDPNCGCGC
jgi:AhpD family alkylhydroperoxidase